MRKCIMNIIMFVCVLIMGCNKVYAGTASKSNSTACLEVSWNDKTGDGTVTLIPNPQGLVYEAGGVGSKYDIRVTQVTVGGETLSNSVTKIDDPLNGCSWNFTLSGDAMVTVAYSVGLADWYRSKHPTEVVQAGNTVLSVNVTFTPPPPVMDVGYPGGATYDEIGNPVSKVKVTVSISVKNVKSIDNDCTLSGAGDWKTLSKSVTVEENGSGEIQLGCMGYDSNGNLQNVIRKATYTVTQIEPSISGEPFIGYSPSSATEGSVKIRTFINLKNATSEVVQKEITVDKNGSGTIELSYTGTNGKSYTKKVPYNVTWIKPTVVGQPKVTYNPSSATKGSVKVKAKIDLKNATYSSAEDEKTVDANGSGTITISYTGTDGKSYTEEVPYNVTWIQPTVTSKDVSYTPKTGTQNDVDVTATIYTKNAKKSSYEKKISVGSNTSGSITIPYEGTDGKSYFETLSYNVTWIMPTVLSSKVSYSTTQNTNGDVVVTGRITTKNADRSEWTNSETKTKNCSGTIYVPYTGTDGKSYSQGISYSVGNIDKIKPVVSYKVVRHSIKDVSYSESYTPTDTEYETIDLVVTSYDASSSDYCSSGTNKIYINGVAYSGSSYTERYESTVNSPITIYSVDNVGNVSVSIMSSDFVGELIEPISMKIEEVERNEPYLNRNNVVVPLHITDGTRYLRKIYVDGVQKTTPARSTTEPYLLTVSTDKTSQSGIIKIVDKKGVEKEYKYEIHDILKDGQNFKISVAGGNVRIENDPQNLSNDIVYFGSRVGKQESTVVGPSTKDMTLFGSTSSDNVQINNTRRTNLNLENLSISSSGKSPIDIQESTNLNFIISDSNRLTSSGTYACMNIPNNKTIYFKGSGKLSATSSGSGAVIGGTKNSTVGNIELLQGKFILKNTGTGSALGSGEVGSVGNIIIRGADIYAESKEGAGIGSGKNGKASKVEIRGGTIVAKSTNGGAAIGSGSGDSSVVDNILIKGGNIYTSSSGNGAGIGSGLESSVGNIKINNGLINCETSGDGVGIGAGRYASVGDRENDGNNVVVINDGKIVCKNIGGGGGIGTGVGGAIYGKLMINGGNVEAYTNGNGPGIGNCDVTIKGGVVKAYSKSGNDISGNNIIIDKWANVEAYNNKTSTTVKRSDGEIVSQTKIAIPRAKNTQSFLTLVEGGNSYRVNTDKYGVVYWWGNSNDNADFWYKGLKY